MFFFLQTRVSAISEKLARSAKKNSIRIKLIYFTLSKISLKNVTCLPFSKDFIFRKKN